MTRDEGLRVTHRQASAHATCCWCGTALGERRTAPHREGDPLTFCSGRCSAEHETAVLRLERLRADRPTPSPEGAASAIASNPKAEGDPPMFSLAPAAAFDWDDPLVLPRDTDAVGWP